MAVQARGGVWAGWRDGQRIPEYRNEYLGSCGDAVGKALGKGQAGEETCSSISDSTVPSSAAMLKIAEMEYSGANSIFLRLLLDKKYALPYRVLDALVFHFLSFRTEKRQLPVLWHQCLLTLAQRYKADLATDQKEALLELLRLQPHPQLSPEIRRELQSAVPRDVEDVPVTME